jgi:diguanylate cyclase (GGDEF)-like protein
MMMNRKIVDVPKKTIKRLEASMKKVVAKSILATAFFFIILNMLQPADCVANDGVINKKVLIIDSFNQDLPISKIFLKGVQDELAQQANLKINYYYEYLDQENLKYLPKYLKEKYSNQKPDLIIVHRSVAFEFMLNHAEFVFPGIPVICAGDTREKYNNEVLPPNFMQVLGSVDIAESFRVLLKTRPITKKIYVVIGASDLERGMMSKLREDLAQFSGQVEIIYLDNLTVPEMLDKVSTITGDAAIMYFFAFKDVAETSYLPRELMNMIYARAKVPIYTTAGSYLGSGIVGGYLFNGELLGKKVADLSLGILQGEKSFPSGVEIFPAAEYVFDWRELKRWDIDPNYLPYGSKVKFSEPSLWDLYRGYVIGTIVVLVLQAMLICGLLTNRRKRKKAEAILAKMNVNLEAMVMERTQELETANKELRTAKERQEDLISVLSQLNKHLDFTSRTDALTGLFNRRHMTEKVEAEFERFHRTGRTFAVVIGDVDHFKQVNDTYGHNSGDFLLRIVADELRNAVRAYDTVSRWGGEEFLCLLPEADINTALKVAERMRSMIVNKNFVWEGLSIPISMTFGVTIANTGDTMERVINRADQALYKGKESGRNKVVLADGV